MKTAVLREVIFPGCEVLPWQPTELKLTATVKAALDVVKEALAMGADRLALKAVCDRLKLDPSNFRKQVTQRPEWQDAIARFGLEVVQHGRALLLHVVPGALPAE